MATVAVYRFAIALLVFGAASSAQARAFELTSPDLPAGQPMANKFIFNGMGCKGENISPALTWRDAPKGTKSFALMVHDPDAPTGGAGIWHWVILNIPAEAVSLAQGIGTMDGRKLPAGARQISTDYDVPGWSGPCPPPGAKPHHYNFTLYALKVEKIDLPSAATASQAGFFIVGNALEQAKLTVSYGR